MGPADKRGKESRRGELQMKTTAVRIHGKCDIRLDSMELPAPKDDEILGEIVTNSVCMSCHKAAMLGPEHKRVPKDVAERPVIIGHEFAGVIRQVGKKWAGKFKPGQKFTVQPAVEYKGSLDAPGYSFQFIGGMTGHIVIPFFIMERDCLLIYEGEGFFKASLSEPMSCIVGAARAQYHTEHTTHEHEMGIRQKGTCAVLAGAGPMGLGGVDYLVHGPMKPSLLIVTDIDQARLDRAALLVPPEDAKRNGVTLKYVNTAATPDPEGMLKAETNGKGFDDVFVFAAVPALVKLADAILGRDGCLNFFAGPTDSKFSVPLNLYNAHYTGTHLVGTSGGNTDDMRESLDLMAQRKVNPAGMVTHIGGITCAVDTIMKLPEIPGGKKLVYTQYDMPLTAIADFAALGKKDPFFAKLAEICGRNQGLWSVEAEDYLLANAKRISQA